MRVYGQDLSWRDGCLWFHGFACGVLIIGGIALVFGVISLVQAIVSGEVVF